MNEDEVRDEYILALAELYEEGGPKVFLQWRQVAKGNLIAEETAGKVIAQLKSEQVIVDEHGNIRFTDSGYRKYLDRIRALRALRSP